MGCMDQRLLLVHAHPDDETIGQGATMASPNRLTASPESTLAATNAMESQTRTLP